MVISDVVAGKKNAFAIFVFMSILDVALQISKVWRYKQHFLLKILLYDLYGNFGAFLHHTCNEKRRKLRLLYSHWLATASFFAASSCGELPIHSQQRTTGLMVNAKKQTLGSLVALLYFVVKVHFGIGQVKLGKTMTSLFVSYVTYDQDL